MTLRDILVAHPEAMWSDGTLWHETADIVRTFDQSDLTRPAVLHEVDGCRTLYFLNPLTSVELGGFALQML